MAPYVLTKPLHGSQKKINYDENGLLIQLELIPNYELESLILSYGDGVEVVEPVELRERIVRRLEKLLTKTYLV